MSEIHTLLGQIQAEQKRQGKLLDQILEIMQEPFGVADLDEILAKGMAMAEQRRVTAAIAQPPKQRDS